MSTENFINRHIGPGTKETNDMLGVVGAESLEQLIGETIPPSIRLSKPLQLADGMSEYDYLLHIKDIASKNKIYKSYIGLGYYNTISPSVIIRNILENPGWYTSYTPYQAEISQGRLEALLNFQTMVSDLTSLPIANASLLDEGTAAAEAMIMFYNARSREAVKADARVFLVSDKLFPQSADIIIARAKPLGIEPLICDCEAFDFNEKVFGAILQYPDERGNISDYSNIVAKAHNANIPVVVAADLLSLALLTPPGEWGADVAVGSTQRFGIPMSFGGPHAAYFATTEKYKRNIPGRIIGVSVDAAGKKAYRMSLQTREQHIKRERATSNICTAQALLAIMAGMYGVYHGKKGIVKIAQDIHFKTVTLETELLKLGCKQNNKIYFDTLEICLPDGFISAKIKQNALSEQINFRYINDELIGISIDETTSFSDIKKIIEVFAVTLNKSTSVAEIKNDFRITAPLSRKSDFLTHKVFNNYYSETAMMRYIKALEIKDLALNRAMIPLGSCTMKLNAATEMFALSWPEFGHIHPFVPEEQAAGYYELIKKLGDDLCEITGFSAISFQPNSGAAGEYSGLMVIRAFHKDKGQEHRNIVLIPASAHGTNPASAVMAGYSVIVVKCDENGNIDMADLQLKAEEHFNDIAALMITYPSTHGVFEENIPEIIRIIHNTGGQVYMDGANMNAQVGLTNPAMIGADVCHLNLHKTFAIPHGGGGPGAGPICVAAHLADYLPGNILVNTGGRKSIAGIASAPFGSAIILTISYAYIKMMGGKGLTEATKYAILNANYLKTLLGKYYPVLFTGNNGHVAHEMILDCNEINRKSGVDAVDIAKRLMDYGFHAPTVAFPVHGTLMVEPTESEPKEELDRFVEAMIEIRGEIDEIINGMADKLNNVIKKAPHTAEMIASDNWDYPYSRMKAAYPMPWSANDKYWPAVTRIDDAFGDRNLVCKC